MLFEEPIGRRWIVSEIGRTGFGAIGAGDRIPEPTNVLLLYESDAERRLAGSAPLDWRDPKVIEDQFFEAFRHGEDTLSERDAAEIEEFGRQLDAFAARRWAGMRIAASVRREAESLASRIREEVANGLAYFSDDDLAWLNEHGQGLCEVARSELKTLAGGEARSQAQARWAHGCALRWAEARLRRAMYGA